MNVVQDVREMYEYKPFIATHSIMTFDNDSFEHEKS